MTYADWHIPLSRSELTLREGLDSLAAVGARQQEIPLIVRLLENPKYRLPGMTLFHGAVDLEAHDRIHLLLGRGLLTPDEAFTIGFTMGSTKRVRRSEEWLFGLLARHVYPVPYTFDDTAVCIFNDAVRLGGVSVFAGKRIRGEVTVGIGPVAFDIELSEKTIQGHNAGYINGPVRIIKRSVEHIRLGPGIASPAVYCDHFHYY